MVPCRCLIVHLRLLVLLQKRPWKASRDSRMSPVYHRCHCQTRHTFMSSLLPDSGLPIRASVTVRSSIDTPTTVISGDSFVGPVNSRSSCSSKLNNLVSLTPSPARAGWSIYVKRQRCLPRMELYLPEQDFESASIHFNQQPSE